MVLTTWKGEKVCKGDITVAKNYLTEKEINSLNRIVNIYLEKENFFEWCGKTIFFKLSYGLFLMKKEDFIETNCHVPVTY